MSSPLSSLPRNFSLSPIMDILLLVLNEMKEAAVSVLVSGNSCLNVAQLSKRDL